MCMVWLMVVVVIFCCVVCVKFGWMMILGCSRFVDEVIVLSFGMVCRLCIILCVVC